MRDFWNNHKKGILGFLAGAFVMVGMVAANVLCGRLPPPFAQICVGISQQAVEQVKRSIEADADAGIVLQNVAAQASSLDLCPGAPDGDFCTSNGYALALPDGGHCRCR